MNGAVESAVREVVRLLVDRRYIDVEAFTAGNRLTATEIEQAIREYGATLIFPPEDAFDSMDAIEVEGVSPPKWSVVMPLWTQQEGRSDLSLELTVEQRLEGTRVEIDNIHVR
jgi:hypothetical protein